MTTTIKNSLLLLIFTTLLQSCFVVGIGNSPSWDNKKEVGYRMSQPDTSIAEINLSRPNSMIPIPFFFIVVDKKNYSTTFYLNTKQQKYQAIDSVEYFLCTKDSVLRQGVCDNTSRVFKEYGEGKNSYHQGWAETKPDLKISKKHQNEDLSVICNFYLKDSNSRQVLLKKTSKLTLNKPSWFWIEWFEK